MSQRARFSLSVLFMLGLAAVAHADAKVIVEVKRADGSSAQGTVTLSQGDSKYTCVTDAAGRCELKVSAGGVYTVALDQGKGAGPKPKTVVIPPSGEVKLIVNAQ